MDRPGACCDPSVSGTSDDFPALLRRKGLIAPVPDLSRRKTQHGCRRNRPRFSRLSLAMECSWPEIVAPRRATRLFTIARIKCWKSIGIPSWRLRACRRQRGKWRACSSIRSNIFRRTQLQEMSVDGKVRALSKLLRDNFGFVMQGVGMVVPIFATYDSLPGASLFLRRDGRAI